MGISVFYPDGGDYKSQSVFYRQGAKDAKIYLEEERRRGENSEGVELL